MLLDFSEIPDEGLRLDHGLQLGERDSGSDEPLVPDPVRLSGHARRGRRGVEIRGEITATLRLECSRCLEPYAVPLRAEFFLVVVSEAVEFGTGENRLDLDDASLFYADRGKVDLREIAREQIDLNLPLKPLCRDDCAGLCPTCGANRNRIECVCPSGDVDPRLAPLLDLRQKRRESREDKDEE
jgi:uncharacterized protein